MKGQRDPGRSVAVQLRHATCGHVIGAAEVERFEEHGSGQVQVRSVRIRTIINGRMTEPLSLDGDSEFVMCQRCGDPVTIQPEDRRRMADQLSEALRSSVRGLETREVHGRRGTLRVTLSG